MRDYSVQNKNAWEYNAYAFWIKEAGDPSDRAKKILADPEASLKRYSAYFNSYSAVSESQTSAVPVVKKPFRWPCWALK